MSVWHRFAQFMLRPYYSVAEIFGLMVLWDFGPWWLAIPLMFAWMFLCGWAAGRVGALQ